MAFSEWFGIYNDSFYPWIFHNEHGWQYVFEVENDGELYLYDLRSEDWWFTSESIYPSFFSFGRGTWNWFFEETVNPRQFVDLESGDFWRDIFGAGGPGGALRGHRRSELENPHQLADRPCPRGMVWGQRR